MIFPPYLKKGDTIGMLCPAGFMAVEKWQTCAATLRDWGYRVVEGSTLYSRSPNYFSGSDGERLADLQKMLDDKNVNAILCGRGGYGLSRIIDQVDFKKFKKHPKWIIGFSDITVLHAHINRKFKIATLHAPMAAAFNDGGYANPYVQSLKAALEGKKAKYHIPSHPFNRAGEAEGQLVGGNLTLLTHLLGSGSIYKTRDRILFLEDVGEYLYNIDRLLIQLRRGGWLKELAGLIIGGFTENRDTERPFGKTVEEIIYDQIKNLDIPICFHFPVSHAPENYALKVGATYRLNVTQKSVTLSES